jgi:hypothetical protein
MAPTLAIVPADTADLRTLTTRDGARLASASARALDGLWIAHLREQSREPKELTARGTLL